MIEFKAECGHTVRAKDDDAGSTVRCTYCGRETQVPDRLGDDSDFPFRDIEPPPSEPPTRRRRRRRPGRRWGLFTRRAPSKTDAYATILRMCYVAGLIAVVYVVGKNYLLPLFGTHGVSERVAGAPAEPPDRVKPPTIERRSTPDLIADEEALPADVDAALKKTPVGPRRAVSQKLGLLSRESPDRLYVGSTPTGATVYCLEESQASPAGWIRDLPGVVRAEANGPGFKVPDGTYVVDVVMAWNDLRLNNPDLPDYRSYLTFRRALIKASDEDRVRLLNQYFVPDEATRTFVEETEEQMFLVRQYRGVQVRNGTSKGVRALFLPRLELPGRKGFSIAQLVRYYLPSDTAYAFNPVQARVELDFYDVPESDRPFVLEALGRIGVVPYVTPDGVLRMFKIGIDDGLFAMKILSDPAG